MNTPLTRPSCFVNQRGLRLCALGFGLLAIWVVALARTASAQTVQLQGTVSPDAMKLTTYGDADSSRTLQLELWFKPRDPAKLKALLAEQQDPKSPQYHKWLTPQEYAQRFGPTDTDFNKVSHWLTAQGFQISGGSAAEGVIKYLGHSVFGSRNRFSESWVFGDGVAVDTH